MKRQIKILIQAAIAKLYPEHRDMDFSVEYPPENVDADFASNAAMVLGKKLGLEPLEIAEKLKSVIRDLPITPSSSPPILQRRTGGEKIGGLFLITAAPPGFLNFKLSDAALLKNLARVLEQPKAYGAADLGRGQLAIVEYFQLNVAKPPHVGHLRSAVIGDALKRILEFVGYKTVSDTHIGDWGTQFGLLLLAYKKLDGKKRVKDSPLEELNDLYVEINKLIEADLQLRDQGKQEFAKLEQGDKEDRQLWEFFVKVSKKKFAEMVKLLQIQPFDYDLGESFYETRMKEIMRRLGKANLLTTGETGERYVDLEKYGLGRLICLKSDGATTYELRDLATVAYRYEELAKQEKADLAWNLYVVDVRQAHDFRQVFKTMELLGLDMSKSRHLEFGFMSLPEGAISTRKGTVISLESLLAEARKRARRIIEEKNPQLKNKDAVAAEVALGAVKYADLVHNRKSDIIFKWEDVLSFEGNTGPYLQYTHARLRSILRKAKGRPKAVLQNADCGRAELLILRKLLKFPDVIADAVTDFMPSHLATYLYELAGSANAFYHSSPVLQEPDPNLRGLRLALVSATAVVLQQGLALLGIEAPEEM